MASTFLVRLKVGSILVDAKGLSQVYRGQPKRQLLAPGVRSRLCLPFALVSLLSAPVRQWFRLLRHLRPSFAGDVMCRMVVDIRYHLASLVAVFFALGLGILVGMSLASGGQGSELREQWMPGHRKGAGSPPP